MVKKIFKIIHKEFGGLHEAAFLLGFSALTSQLLALFRDRLLAGTFGASKLLDVYYTAFRIPDFVYVTIASFVSVTVLIPFLIDRIESGNLKAAKEFMDSVFTAFCLIMIVVSGVLFFVIPFLTKFIAPGFSSFEQEQLITFTRILLFSPFLLGISNLLGSVTQSFRKFFVYALSPLLYNLGIIIGIVFFYPAFGGTGLVWGVVLGATMHLLIQLPVIVEHGFWPTFTSKINYQTLKKIITISLPRTIALASNQLSIIVLVSMASLMKAGSIAVFNFSYNLQSVPLAIVGVSYSVAAFPVLTRLFAQGEKEKFLNEISTAIRHIAFWSFISGVLFIVLRAQIVRVILGAGHFNWSDTRLTAACLAIFAVSVVAQSLCQLFVRSYYAAGRTRTPLIINILSALIVVVLAFVLQDVYLRFDNLRYGLEFLLRVDGLAGTSILILPLAFSIGLIFNLIAHWFMFERDFYKLPRGTFFSCLQTLSASILGGMAAYEMLNLLEGWLNIRTFIGIFTQGFLAGLAGLAVFAIVLFLLGNKELKDIMRALHGRFWKAQVAVPEQGAL